MYVYIYIYISIPPFIPPVALHFARQTPRCRASPGAGRLGNQRMAQSLEELTRN